MRSSCSIAHLPCTHTTNRIRSSPSFSGNPGASPTTNGFRSEFGSVLRELAVLLHSWYKEQRVEDSLCTMRALRQPARPRLRSGLPVVQLTPLFPHRLQLPARGPHADDHGGGDRRAGAAGRPDRRWCAGRTGDEPQRPVAVSPGTPQNSHVEFARDADGAGEPGRTGALVLTAGRRLRALLFEPAQRPVDPERRHPPG